MGILSVSSLRSTEAKLELEIWNLEFYRKFGKNKGFGPWHQVESTLILNESRKKDFGSRESHVRTIFLINFSNSTYKAYL